MEVISKREVKRKKKNPTAQPFRSIRVMQEENLLMPPSSLSSVVGRARGWGGGLGRGKGMGKGSRLRPMCTQMAHWWYPTTTRVQHDLSRMLPFVDYLDPKMATSMGCASRP